MIRNYCVQNDPKKMSAEKMSVNKMSVDKMTVYETI